ncbi:hypothetical protein KFZ70_08810 [Tamlana fucoidanivorans]|uniref:DUF4168 domain-containing protein n=1 Tax=Allotamlana fucoidanivorans TaxID=2583814 RepID=A0A5C4SPF1_9FLAO|nr:hypothetical protein [Tamlana fucoidanivorans]TNJ46138.1 hypothetical protein FGF67_03870 [Tamlana fucoidanivorans]
MKKVILFTIVALCATASSLVAQTLPSIKSSELTETVKSTDVSSKQEEQIKQALMKDEELQEKTINHLKSNPETKDAFMNLTTKNSGGLQGLMSSVLGDKSLTQAAIDYVSKNPDLLQKALKLVGL